MSGFLLPFRESEQKQEAGSSFPTGFMYHRLIPNSLCITGLFRIHAEVTVRENFRIRSGTFFPAISIVALFVMSACGGSGDDAGQGAPGPGQWEQRGGQTTSVETREVTLGSISDQVRNFGTIRAQDVVQISPQVSDRITAIHVDLGDSVRQGDPLASIYDVSFRDDLEQARAQYRQVASSFERDSTFFARQQLLYNRQAISRSEFEEALAAFQGSRAQLEASSASLTQSRENLANTTVRSPVNGVVLRRFAAVGDVASTGQPIFEVANLAGYETRIWLPMHDWEEMRIGLPVELRLSGRDGVMAEGFVSRISPQLDPESGLGEVVVTLSTAGSGIRQGVLVEALVTLVTHDQTVVIPRSAIIEQVETYIEPETNSVELRRNHTVFVALGDSVAEQRHVVIGLQQGERVEISSGLEAGEQLVVTGHRSLSDGARVRVAGSERVGANPEREGSERPVMRQGGGGGGASGGRRAGSRN